MYVALSFDDGYLSHYSIAQTLAHMNIRATFYCIAHFKNPLFARHEYIQEIAELGHEVGSHTVSHQDLTKLSIEKLDFELKISKRLLEDVIGDEIIGMAYPNGYFNLKVLSVASRYYEYARSAAVYKQEDPYNVKPPNRYVISALQVRYLPKLSIKALKNGKMINPVIFAHNISCLKIIWLISYLKALGAKFVTVKELVDNLMKNGIL
jgi:peptidoglycan/xylan/chitin deacetylase (PgdA/CDA1 family)